MKRSSHPRRECACESRRAGASQARFEKKVPEKGDENIVARDTFARLTNLKKRSPRKGTKTGVIDPQSVHLPTIEKKVPEKGDENSS